MAAPNIVNVTTITAKSNVQLIGTSSNTIISNANSSSTVVKVNSLYVSNVDTANTTQLDVDLYRGNVAYRLAKSIAIPPNSALDVINKTVYLEEGDSLRLTANAINKLEAVSSYEVIS